MNGHALRRGQRVVLFYASANRDESVFTDPDRFDITRSPNPHVGYGGGGPHYCLGTFLAKQEMKALSIERDAFHGDWNYVIRPRPASR